MVYYLQVHNELLYVFQDTSGMKVNHAWKVNPDLPFALKGEFGSLNLIQLVVKIERYMSHYQNIFIYPGVGKWMGT